MAKIFADQALRVVWEASYCIKRNKAKWTSIDVRKCIDVITKKVARESSLQTLASLMLGICQVFAHQISLSYNQHRLCIKLQIELSRLCNKKRMKKILTLPRKDKRFQACLRLIRKVDMQLESGVRPRIRMAPGRPKRLVDLIELPSCYGDDESSDYFQQLNQQVGSVDFLEECQDILQEHFGEKNAPTEAAESRFSDAHPIESTCLEYDNVDTYPIEDDDYQCHKFDKPTFRNRVKPAKRKRKLVKFSKQIDGFVPKWNRSKVGYCCLLQECQDANLSMPNRSMSVELRRYFKTCKTPCQEEISEEPEEIEQNVSDISFEQ